MYSSEHSVSSSFISIYLYKFTCISTKVAMHQIDKVYYWDSAHTKKKSKDDVPSVKGSSVKGKKLVPLEAKKKKKKKKNFFE